MTQLTSPPRSAIAVADWLMNSGRGEWPVSLGSVEVLVSWPPADHALVGSASTPREPTIENIRESFEKWADRCRQHPDNIALFYFCGHGLQGDGQYLLASDFNRFATAPFAQAFDFDETRLALQQSGPQTQLFVVDACRDSYLERAGSVPGLAVRDLFKPNACVNELTLRLPAFEQAFGRHHEVSRLTQALLHCLDGQAATPDEYGGWEVRTDNIRRSINHLLSPEGQDSGLTRTVEATGFGDTPLLYLADPPPAKLTVRCLPPTAASRTKLVCRPQNPPPQPLVDCGTAQEYGLDQLGTSIQEWRMELTSGFYTVSAHCDNATTERTHGVFPPRSRLSMRVTS
ncbi:caspase family protein [Streptomyces sp. NBC_00474]|uniref:caspase family protein n=1 Tax=Streptomyces sp. NBC_00474 TaxID=2975754 RepID=UPI00225ACE5E|nr:caspase family protein [Streptomyces sp. NBC_00474]MCX5051045.1 caspase family protein [Streptomyces sp. NBC_00474]